MKSSKIAVALAFAAFCFQAAAHSSGTTNKVVSFVGKDLRKVALAVVDEKPLTALEVKDAVLIAAKMRELSTGSKSAEPSGRRANLTAMRLAPQLMSSMILDEELDRRGIKSSAKSDADVLARYNAKFKVKSKTKEELFARFGNLAPAFKKQFARESRYREMYNSLPELKVTDEEVKKFCSDISNRVEKCNRINKRAKHQIECAWKELKEGRPWDVVATNYTEDALLHKTFADNWKDWISLNLNKIEPIELMTAVSKLKPGEYTNPIETEEGFVIAKLVERDGDFCILARILIRMAVKVEVPKRDEALKKLRKEKEIKFQKGKLEELKKTAKIEYPFGKKFVFKIWDEPKK